MKSKWSLISSIIQLVIGIMAVGAFAVLSTGEENMIKWSITLVLAIAFIILGIIGILDYKKNR